MKPLYILAYWQRLAGFASSMSKAFVGVSEKCKLFPEALPSTNRRVSVCQNRYPSPSRGSDQNFLVRPSCICVFRQSAAQNSSGAAIVIAYQATKTLLDLREITLTNKSRGKRICKRTYHSSLSQHFWAWVPAAKGPTLNARPLVALRAVLSANSSKTANASRALRSVQPVAHWQTTSRSYKEIRTAASRDSGGPNRSKRLNGVVWAGFGEPACSTVAQSAHHRPSTINAKNVTARAIIRARLGMAGTTPSLLGKECHV